VRERAGRAPHLLPSHRYARAIADLPGSVLIIQPFGRYRAWDLFYLRPLGTRHRELPQSFMRPHPTVCRFLLRGNRGVPPEVVVERRPEFAARPLSEEPGKRRGFLFDLDACLPAWV
jgi:hypothetical protein